MTPSDQAKSFKTYLWVGRVIGALVAVAFLGSALSKLAHVGKVVEGLTLAGIPERSIVPIGILELSCLVLYLLPKTSILGTFLLTGYIGGAIVTHIIGRQNLLPPLIVGILMFVSAYLRHAELRDFVPVRSSHASDGKTSHRSAFSSEPVLMDCLESLSS